MSILRVCHYYLYCDNCGAESEADATTWNETRAEFLHRMRNWGWQIGRSVTCPKCVEVKSVVKRFELKEQHLPENPHPKDYKMKLAKVKEVSDGR